MASRINRGGSYDWQVASNGLITEYARREGTQARGRSYLIFVMLKDAIGGTLGTLLVGLGLNGRK